MTVKTIWPNTTIAVDDWPIRGGGAATVHDALESFGEEAWIESDPDGPGDTCDFTCGMQSYTLLANEKCYGFRHTIRKDGFSTCQWGWDMTATTLSALGFLADTISVSGTRTTQVLPWRRYELTQSNINNLQLRGTAVYNNHVEIYWSQGELDVYTKPVVNSVTTPTGVQSSRIPTTTWSPNYQEGGSYAPYPSYATLKFFKSATYGGGGFDPEAMASDGPTFVVPDSASTAHVYTPPNVNANFLGDGTWKAYVKISQNHLVIESAVNVFRPYDSAWVAGPAFTITNPPPVPTLLTPAQGSTVNTDVPTLGGQVNQPTMLARSKLEFQLATDAAITANVRTITEPAADLRLSGTTSEVVPNASALFQGAAVPRTWYMRARQVDQFGTNGTWSAVQSFTVTHPPAPSNISPTGGQSVGMDTGDDCDVTVSWDFTDTSPVDTQTAYQIYIEKVSDSTLVHDTGKLVSTATTDSITIVNANKDIELRLKIRLWDRDDVVGSYSAWNLFMVQEFPVVTIGEPVELSEIDNPTPEVTWSVSASLGRVQSRYRVLFGLGPSTSPGPAIYDTSFITSDDVSFVPPLPVLETGNNYWVEVQVYDTVSLLGSDRNYFDTQWDEPDVASFTVDVSPYDLEGYVLVEWDDTNLDADFYVWRLYRRPSGTEDDYTLLVEYTDVDTAYEYRDWLPGSGIEYDYLLNQVALRFEALVEGEGDIVTDTPVGTHYWLIHPDLELREDLSLRLRHVTADDMAEEYENEIIHLLSRGRHQDIGDRLGYSGGLTAELWDDENDLNAREQRLALEDLKALKIEVYFRNPFGDVFKIGTGNMEIKRLGGVGRREFSTLTLEYTEVLDEDE